MANKNSISNMQEYCDTYNLGFSLSKLEEIPQVLSAIRKIHLNNDNEFLNTLITGLNEGSEFRKSLAMERQTELEKIQKSKEVTKEKGFER
jgi:hypothetical protein